MTNALVTDVFNAVDALDSKAFAGFFASTGRITFGNGEPLVGPAAVEAGTAGFLGTIAGIHHEVVKHWVVGTDTISELRVTYTRKDGRDVTIPVVTIWTVDSDGQFEDYRVIFDLAPVFG